MINPMLDSIFKTIGFNPDELKTQIKGASDRFNQVIGHFDRKLNLVDERLADIENILRTAYPDIRPAPKHLPQLTGLGEKDAA